MKSTWFIGKDILQEVVDVSYSDPCISGHHVVTIVMLSMFT